MSHTVELTMQKSEEGFLPICYGNVRFVDKVSVVVLQIVADDIQNYIFHLPLKCNSRS